MNKFEENYKNFKRRQPVQRFVRERMAHLNKWDTSHIRFVDTATPEEIMDEYYFIRHKQSDLSAKERDLIVKMVENG